MLGVERLELQVHCPGSHQFAHAVWIEPRLVSTGAVAEKRELIAVPAAADIARADKFIKDLYKADYTKKAAADKLALAQKLLEQGQKTKEDAAARYVSYRDARDLAVGIPDPALAMQAIDVLASEFIVEALDLKAAALEQAGRAPSTPASNQALYETATTLVDQALARDNFDQATTLAKVAQSGAIRTKQQPLMTAAQAKLREIDTLKKEFTAVQKALQGLADKPDDPALNLLVGKYRAFTQGNWEEGLPLLAKSGDAKLKDLAGKELAQPQDGKEQLAIGDAWFDLAETESSLAKKQLQRRAVHWYRQAQEKLTGLDQLKVEQRLDALKAVAGVAASPVPKEKEWLVLFRSSNPAIWNTNVKTAADFALSLDKVPDGISYLRITREMDFVIIPMTKDRLTRVTDDGRFGFEGTAHDGSGGRHLGVYSKDWPCKNGDVCIRILPWFAGWGFGHIHFGNNAQGYCWNGVRVPPCVFEIAVKSGKLTDAESKKLVGAADTKLPK